MKSVYTCSILARDKDPKGKVALVTGGVFVPYYVSNASVLALTESQAPEILVNAIAPGSILAPPDLTPDGNGEVIEATPLQRWAARRRLPKRCSSWWTAISLPVSVFASTVAGICICINRISTEESRSMSDDMNWRSLEQFSFGDSRELSDELANLVLAGRKRATCWAASDGPITSVGKRMVMLDGAGVPRAILETVELVQKRFSEIDEAFAFDEGEGDRTLTYWRIAHQRYFERHGTFSVMSAALLELGSGNIVS